MHSLQHIKRNNAIAANEKLYTELFEIVGPKLLVFTNSIDEIQDELYSAIKTLSNEQNFDTWSAEDPLAEKAREVLNKFFKEVLWGDVKTRIESVYNNFWLANRNKSLISKPNWVDKKVLENLKYINTNIEGYIKDLEDIVNKLIKDNYCQGFFGADNSTQFISYVKNIRSSALEIECQQKILAGKINNSIILWKLLNFR